MKKTLLISATCAILSVLAATPFAHAVSSSDFSDDRASVCAAPLAERNPDLSKGRSFFTNIKTKISSIARVILPPPKTTAPGPVETTPLPYRPRSYSLLDRNEVLKDYLDTEFNNPISASFGSDRPGPVFNLHSFETSLADNTKSVEKPEHFPKSIEELKKINKVNIMMNHATTMNTVIPILIEQDVGAWDAFKKIIKALMNNVYLQGVPDDFALNSEFQAKAQRVRLRANAGLVVGFANSVAPSAGDMDLIMQRFSQKLETMMGQANSLFDAVSIAVWARHNILELQPGTDGNTRGARAFMSWIIVRVGKKMGLELSSSKIDLESINTLDSTVDTLEDGVLFNFDVLTGVGLKSLLSSRFIKDLKKYSQETKQPFYHVMKPGDALIEGATNVTEAEFTDSKYLDADRPEWKTVRDFELKKIDSASLSSIKKDPQNQIETHALVKALGHVL